MEAKTHESIPVQSPVPAHARAPAADSFGELMAEQLRHAPWLLLSITLHGLAVLVVLWMPVTQVHRDERAVVMNPPEEVEPLPEPPEEEPPPVPEEAPDEPQLQDATLPPTPDAADSPAEFPSALAAASDALEASDLTATLGLGAGPRGPYGGRRGSGRGDGSRGGRQTIDAIERGLEWLAAHQDRDGRWDADGFMKHDPSGTPSDGPGNPMHDVGVTGLALLAFLGDGNDMNRGPHRDVVRRGIRWLRHQQDPESGRIGNANSGEFIYDHAIATYAMVEAYGLSEAKLLRRYAQRAIDYLESHRNPHGVWRYQPRDNDNDTSVTGWCVMAYTSAEHFGLQTHSEALTFAEEWFTEMTDPVSGRTGYIERGSGSSRRPGVHGEEFPVARGECLTAVALMCRFFMGQDPNRRAIMARQADRIVACPPLWSEAEGSIDHYYWYYGSYALFQMGSFGGRDYWREWSQHLGPNVVQRQRRDGHFRGSWDPAGAWGEDGGRVYSTAILVLTLEAFYRYTLLVH